MTAAGTYKPASSRSESRPLLWALLISLAVHVLAVWTLVVVGAAMLVFSSVRREVLAEMQRTQQARAAAQKQPEPVMMFVDVDPNQAVKEAPKKAKYYSSHSTEAANPDPKADTDTPKIDGTQVHVVQTQDPARAKQFPLQPSPPKPQSKPDDQPPKADPKPDNPAPKVPPGDLAMKTTEPTAPPPPAPTPPAEPEHQRPHTIEEAKNTLGMKSKQDGGVSRIRMASSLEAMGSPLGEYDERVIDAIRQDWYGLIDSHSVSMDHVGKVVVEFHLNYDGSVSDMKVVESDVGDLLSYLCEKAIHDPEPYEKWSLDMRRMIDAPYRDVTFTFYYE
jgi:outer membrane biosynthesis protein TonB